MTALPPPTQPPYAQVGLEIGVIYGVAMWFVWGPAAVLFPLAGYLAGKTLGALYQ